MALHGDEDRDDQARSKAMLETAFQCDAFERVPKRGPNLLDRKSFMGFEDVLFSGPARKTMANGAVSLGGTILQQ